MPPCPLATPIPPQFAVPLPWQDPGDWLALLAVAAALARAQVRAYRGGFPHRIATRRHRPVLALWLVGGVGTLTLFAFVALVAKPADDRLRAWQQAGLAHLPLSLPWPCDPATLVHADYPPLVDAQWWAWPAIVAWTVCLALLVLLSLRYRRLPEPVAADGAEAIAEA